MFFESTNFLGWKNYWLKFFFGLKKSSLENSFGSTYFFGSKKFFGSKFFLTHQKSFWWVGKRYIRFKRNVWSQNFFGRKICWVKKFDQNNFLGEINFWSKERALSEFYYTSRSWRHFEYRMILFSDWQAVCAYYCSIQ